MNKSESKYFNTAVRMDEALILLMEKKEFTYITIKEICECAGVNRSTFYLHYENMGDLLAEALEHMNAGFMDYFETDTQSVLDKIEKGEKEELNFVTPEYLIPYLNFIRDKKRLFSAALNRPESFQSHLVFEKMASDLFRPIMSRFCLPEEEQDYVLHFYLEGIVGIISEWLRRDCREPVEKVADIIIACVRGETPAGL